MNGAHIAIGCAFLAIGSASMAQVKKAEDETGARKARLSGTLMILAGVLFVMAGAFAGN